MQEMKLENLRKFLSQISFQLFGQKLHIRADIDQKYGKRCYLQVFFHSPCSKTNSIEEWHGAKFYLSLHMTEDEILKRAYKACKDAVEHEAMEGFKFNGQIVFNPHVSFRELLKVSPKEVNREISPPFDF